MRWFLLTAVLTTTTASALVLCSQFTQAYAPSFVAATVDGNEAFIDPTPDTIVAGDDQQIEFRYGAETLIFVPAGGSR